MHMESDVRIKEQRNIPLLQSGQKYPKSNKYRILKMQNQYPHVIKSPKPKQSNAWRSNSVPNVYKNLNHRVNHFKSNLSGDIETNPGPVINSTKTIQAPYSQDNVAMFGLNAGTQCVAMSLVSLIYNKSNGVVSTMDLVNIMNIGNELYSGLSSLSNQSYLLFTEVPEMIIVFNINYQLQYSPSYTGTIHGTCEVQDFNYCMSFANAMQALLGQNYNSFFLTILSTTVGFYCNGDVKFKIFDSHVVEIHMVCPILKELVCCWKLTP